LRPDFPPSSGPLHASDPRRVSRSNGKLYWYGSGDEILAETDASGNTLNEYIFFSGKRIAMLPAGGNPIYYAEDLLGSSRVMTQNNGAVCYDADFDPYGGEHAYTNNCPSTNAYKFEGKERDAETGNDDFGARYYTSRFGRWLSADWSSTPVPVPYANLTNPQTLNLYAMVSDDPESFADLDGHIQQGSAGLSAESGGIDASTGELHDALAAAAGLTQNQQQAQAAQKQSQDIATAALDIANHHTSDYLESKSKDGYPAGKDKCNELAADAVQKAGLPRPQVPKSGILGWLGFKRDPTSHEWADPNVHIPGWSDTKPLSQATRGDVIAQQHNQHGSWGHVGIVVGPGRTASVNSTTNPPGLVTVNSWGFRPTGQNGEGPHDPAPVVRSYVGSNP